MLTQQEWEKINDIISNINGIKSLTAMRTAFLQKLMQLIDFDFSDFNLGQQRGRTLPALVDPVVVSRFSKKFEETFTAQYQNKFSELDYVKWVFSSPESLVYRESDLVNDEVRKKSTFYLDYLAPSTLVQVAGISIISGGIFVGAVTIYRTSQKDDFSEKDLYILQQLLPHLQNKLSLEQERTENNIRSVSYLLCHHYGLTEREVEIIGHVYKGLSNLEIATALKITSNTVKKHITKIFDKLQVRSRTLLIRFLIENQLNTLWQ